MRRVAWALVIVTSLISMPNAGANEAARTSWHTEFETALAEAERLNLPLLVHFHAKWCGPCRKMEAQVLNNSAVIAACGKTCVAVKVDTDERSDLASKYGVAALPTDVFVGPDGTVLGKHVGQATRDVYLARMGEMNDKLAASGTAVADSDSTAAKEDTAVLLSRLASAGGIGLDGYSPVSLTTSKVWREGSPEFAWRHAGAIYFMASAEELEKFKASPEKYAPQHSGFDPLLLSTDQVAIRGQITYGSFYKDRLYLHATEASRATFIKSPEKYPAPDEIAIPASIATQRPPVVAEIPVTVGS